MRLLLAVLTLAAAVFGATALQPFLVPPTRAAGVESLGVSRVVATPVPTAPPKPALAALRPAVTLDDALGSAVRGRGPSAMNGSVEIPAIGVSAPLVKVGINSRGEMDTPRNARDVAFLDMGGFPGPTNNAVLAGHISWAGVKGSFGSIDRMKPEDQVIVRVDGSTWTFRVEWVRLIDPKTASVDEIMGSVGRPSVTLITCGGPFDRRTRHHTMRTIVRATLMVS